MKRILALILALCVMLSSLAVLASCGSGSGNENVGASGGEQSGEGNSQGGSTGNDSGNQPGTTPGGNSGNTPGGDSGNTPGGTTPGGDSGNTPGGNTPGGDSGNGDVDYNPDCQGGDHLDENNDDYCDLCNTYVIVVIDFYVLNDLHGKFCDSDSQPGVDELATYFKQAEQTDDHVVLMSSGDMWQGTAESSLTSGVILTEWMNEMNFVSMTLGNHEFDWGEEPIRTNHQVAEFPFLAINIYNYSTGALADYCTPSVMIERGGVKIGIIGAIGDCYSSISSDMVEDVYFKVGNELTNLVKAESQRLRAEGADIIVYSLHDGYDRGSSGTKPVTSTAISGYYDSVLSSGYVDLVFEGHSHQAYTLLDPAGIYHLQGGGENSGLSHVEIAVNSANGNNKVQTAGVVSNYEYRDLPDDPATEALEDKYSDIIEYAYSKLGVVSKTYGDYEIEDEVAKLYLEAGLEKWGNDYDIVLGGGFLRTRSPYDLSAGEKTYADLLSLFPFNNRLVLCSISGSNLKNRFINTSNSDYHCALSSYGSSLSISSSKTYYVVVDTYTALYAPNGLTIVDYFEDGVYARDLLADAIKEGRFEESHDGYTLTSIPDALAIGATLGNNQTTTEYYYIKGTVKSAPNSTYGNLYLVDENGNEIYVYGLYDTSGNRYDSMSNKPQAGDTIIVYSTIYKYVNTSTIIELKNATLISVE